MKFLGSLITFTLLSICTVFSIPVNVYDGTFHYWISDDMRATVMGVIDKNVLQVTIKPYVWYNNQRCYVHQIGAAAFSNTAVQSIIINSNVQSMHFSPNAFYNAKNIRTIELYTQKVTGEPSAFDNCGTNLGFIGVGTTSLINDLAKKILQSWNLPVNKDYTNVSDYQKMRALFDLAKKVKENFSYNTKIAYPDNTAVVLALKIGGTNGISRAFRILALNMGFQYNDVHVGGDGGYYSWNLVHINKGNGKKWYNLDIVHTDFSSYTTRVFKTDSTQSSVTSVKPSKWIIFINQYNFNGEQVYNPITENFTNWLIRNRQGVRAD